MKETVALRPINRDTEKKREGFRIVQSERNYGRGKVVVLQVVPDGIQETNVEQPTTRQIFIPGWNRTGKGDLPLLEGDLLTLAKVNKEVGGGSLITMGVVFVGERANTREIVDNKEFNFPEGTRVTRVQTEQAQDIVAATQEFVVRNNAKAEVIGFSTGGAIAQIADFLAKQQDQPFDLVGLLNTAGWNKNHELPMTTSERRAMRRRHPQKESVRERDDIQFVLSERAVYDRLKRSWEENWSGRHSITYPLISATETPYLIGISRDDGIYPRKKIDHVLERLALRDNMYVVNLGWKGHVLGGNRKLDQRRERLELVAKEIVRVRQARSELNV